MQTTRSTRLRSLALLAAGLLLLTFALAACSSGGSSKSSGSTSGITIKDIAFPADPISAKASATVTITNEDQFAHTVTSNDNGKSFNVTVQGGKTATITAPSKAGTYKFHCNIHSQMQGTLVVT